QRFAPGDSWFVKQGTEVEWKILTPRFVKHYLANVETR
ncbi:TPA: cupin domain-containing protein, partial [Klebsiella pneumoniae]